MLKWRKPLRNHRVSCQKTWLSQFVALQSQKTLAVWVMCQHGGRNKWSRFPHWWLMDTNAQGAPPKAAAFSNLFPTSLARRKGDILWQVDWVEMRGTQTPKCSFLRLLAWFVFVCVGGTLSFSLGCRSVPCFPSPGSFGIQVLEFISARRVNGNVTRQQRSVYSPRCTRPVFSQHQYLWVAASFVWNYFYLPWNLRF